jgi:hypothetical protein
MNPLIQKYFDMEAVVDDEEEEEEEGEEEGEFGKSN